MTICYHPSSIIAKRKVTPPLSDCVSEGYESNNSSLQIVLECEIIFDIFVEFFVF